MAKENGEKQSPPFTPQPATAKRFFDRAAEVASTNNFDYALEMYRDGIKWDPDALEIGHKPLRELGQKRRLTGGKGPGMGDQSGARKAKEPNEKLSWAAYLLAKDPDNPKYMEEFLKAALTVEAKQTAKWMAIILVETNRDSNKPQLSRYLMAMGAFEQLALFDEAVAACQLASRLKPNDMVLTNKLKNLSAEQTMQRGKYNEGKDFKDSLVNKDKQLAQQQDLSVVTQDVTMERQMANARKELEESPNQAGKIYAVVELLCKRGKEEEENEAIGILQKAYASMQSYRFRERIGEIRMKQYHRKAALAVAALKAQPDNQELKKAAQQVILEARALEEQEYGERVANYPTDLTLKFEYGRRLYDNKKFDQAIPILQEAANDAKSRLRAMNLLGQSFFNLNFFNEAVDTFRLAISHVEMVGSDTAKELYYNLGRALEQMGESVEADKSYSQVVQWDFNYRDVRQRIQKIRQERKGEPAVTPGAGEAKSESAGTPGTGT